MKTAGLGSNLELYSKHELKPKNEISVIDPPIRVEYCKDDKFKLIDNLYDLQPVLAEIRLKKIVALDTETSGLDFIHNHVVGMSICFEEESSYYLPFRHKNTYHKQLKWEEVLPLLLDVFSDPEIVVIFHNAKFDLHFLEEEGLTFKGKFEDTMIMAHLLDENRPKSLKYLAKATYGDTADQWSKGLNEFFTLYARAFKLHKASLTYDLVPIPMMTQYAAADTLFTYQLYNSFLPELRQNTKLYNLYRLEKKVLKVLMRMENVGVLIDLGYVDKSIETARELMDKIRMEVLHLLNRNIDLDSPKQIGLLLSDLGIKTGKVTAKSKQISVDQVSLEKVRDAHPFIPLLLSYRRVKKLSSTYFESFKNILETNSNSDGRIRCSFSQTRTKTGRLACLAKGTHVDTLRDVSKYPKGIPIESVKPGDYVYCFDDNLKLDLRKVLWSGKTGKKKVVRLHWQGDGRQHSGYLDLTDDHPIRMLDGTYKQVKHLKKGDRILSLHRSIDKHHGYSRLWATGQSEICREHFFAYKKLTQTKPEVVHHVNGNKVDNRLSNLVGMNNSDHAKLHSQCKSEISKKRMSDSLKKVWRENRNYMLSAVVRYGKDCGNWLGLTKGWIIKELWRANGKPTEVCRAFGIDYATFKKYCKTHRVNFREISQQFTARGERIDLNFVKKWRERQGSRIQPKLLSDIGLGFYRWKSAQEKYGFTPYNHRVVKLEKINKVVDVYDLKIEGYPNFIANEICVHNSSKPNLQNIQRPVSGEGLNVRQAFIPLSDDYVMIFIDLSQIELRLTAHFSEDEKFINAYHTGEDIHTRTASEIFGVSLAEVKEQKELRQIAKTLNFAIIYGARANRLSAMLGKSKQECQNFINMYFKQYKGVYRFIQNSYKHILHSGWIENFYGRVRRLPEVFDTGPHQSFINEKACREGTNFIIQSTAAEMFKLGMCKVDSLLQTRNAKSSLIMNIHDEIVLYMHKGELDLVEDIKVCMEDFNDFKVPILAEVSYSTTHWADKKEVNNALELMAF